MQDDWTPPASVGEYLLERPLGQGAMAQVWLARDTLLERPVALKFALKPPAPEERQRFLLEARAIARLRHPNVIVVHHYGELEARPYLVTEVLSGRSLAELPQPVPAERVLAIGVDLARGLAACHAQGIVHRDVKPANVFLCDDDVVKLLDFGLAKIQQEELGVDCDVLGTTMRAEPTGVDLAATIRESGPTLETGIGALVGTPLYLAPEVWQGEPPSRRSDIYSLGAVLHQLLSGAPPYVAPTIGELRELVTAGAPPPLREVAPETPLALAAAVDRCLARDPRARPTADELRDVLEALVELAGVAEDERGTGNPYRGLLPFDQQHRALFFGRGVEVRAVLAELRAAPLVLVVGPSGAGKSSLVRAGVLPRILAGHAGPGAWRVLALLPGRHPLEALCVAAAAALGRAEEEVEARLREQPAWLGHELRAHAGETRTLVFVDQLEEAWTLAAAGERTAFLAALGSCIDAAPAARLVATLRSDFLGRLEDLGELRAEALRNTYVLPPLSRDGIRQAIVEPARRRGLAVDAGLVERMTTDCGPGALPLMQFALSALWDARPAGATRLAAADLDRIGGLGGALATHADAVLSRLTAPVRAGARRVLLALVTVDGTKARRREDELVAPPPGGAEERTALTALVDGRLVVAVDAESGGTTYELAHEALLSGWPTLAGWLEEEASARAVEARLGRAAAEWERLGRAPDGLWTGRRLRELDALAGRRLGPREEGFVTAARRADRAARRRRWIMRLGAPLAVAAVLVAARTAIRLQERRETAGFVSARVDEAGRREREAIALDGQAAEAASQAFGAFDANQRGEAERRWAEHLRLAAEAGHRYAEAAAELDAALGRDPGSTTARARAAALTARWLALADRSGDDQLAGELARRLESLDPQAAARAAAPVVVEVRTDPPGADLLLHAVELDADGRRVEGPGRPIAGGAGRLELAPGSYVLAASAAGRFPTRLPFLARPGLGQLVVPLPPAGAVPPGFIYVPAGEALIGSARSEAARRSQNAPPRHRARTGAYLVAAHEVTFAEYLEFLASLPPGEREARLPRDPPWAALRYDPDGVPVVTLNGVTARAGEPLCRPRRTVRRCQDWSRIPVLAISWHDARAYAAWLAATGRVRGARLCSRLEWERVARGADGRRFVHGDVLRPEDANTNLAYASDPEQLGADEVGSYAGDLSPFGVRDMTGNALEWCADPFDAVAPTMRMKLGGSWYSDALACELDAQQPIVPESHYGIFGARVCADPP